MEEVKSLEDELFDIYEKDDTIIHSLIEIYEKGRADERENVLEKVHEAMAYKYHCKEDMCEAGMTCADCLKAYMEDLYNSKGAGK